MKAALARRASVLLLALSGACGSSIPGAAPTDAAQGGRGGTGSDDAGPESPPANDAVQAQDCGTASAALALMLHATPGAQCTVIVRLDYRSLAVLGYQTICGAAAMATDAQARATAAADAGFGGNATTAPALNPDKPADEFVFYQSAGDFGGAGVVSARNGLTVFGGSVFHSGYGNITYPMDWRAAQEVGTGCPRAEGIPSSHGYSVGAVITDAGIAAAITAVEKTAVPAAMWRSGQVLDAVVLAYARSLGLSAATGTTDGNEWIVLVNGQ